MRGERGRGARAARSADARGAGRRPGRPCRAVLRAGASSCGRGRTSGRGGRAVTPAGPARSIPQPVRAARRAQPRPCPSVPAATRRSTSVRASCSRPGPGPAGGMPRCPDAAPRWASGPLRTPAPRLPATPWRHPGTDGSLRTPAPPVLGAPMLCAPAIQILGVPQSRTPTALWVPGVPRVADPVKPPKEVPRCRAWAAVGTPSL